MTKYWQIPEGGTDTLTNAESRDSADWANYPLTFPAWLGLLEAESNEDKMLRKKELLCHKIGTYKFYCIKIQLLCLYCYVVYLCFFIAGRDLLLIKMQYNIMVFWIAIKTKRKSLPCVAPHLTEINIQSFSKRSFGNHLINIISQYFLQLLISCFIATSSFLLF